MRYFRSLLFTLLLFVSPLLPCLLIVLTGLLPYRFRISIAIAWAKGVMWMLKAICRLDYVVEGRENMPGKPGVIMIKHTSAWEVIAQFCIFDNQSWVIKRELMWAPFIGWALLFMRPIPVNRAGGHTAVEQVIKKGSRRMRQGMGVMVFPEGTRMEPGQTRRYGLSGVLLALEVGRSIIPVAHNAGDFWLRRGLLKKPGTIRLVIGPPIDVTGKEPVALNLEAQHWIESKMREISSAYE
ncbi:MAG: lysophospholipid acyltransferase family protein [Gammaproteobacteria bacterium]|nr:lysophospholipid acyltransferase family protein [Gammaproteobacteria bacterium]